MGTRWRTGAEVKGRLSNAVGSQYPSHYLGTWCIQHYYRRCEHLGCQQSTELTSPADLNGLVRFAWKTKSGFCACAIIFQKLRGLWKETNIINPVGTQQFVPLFSGHRQFQYKNFPFSHQTFDKTPSSNRETTANLYLPSPAEYLQFYWF